MYIGGNGQSDTPPGSDQEEYTLALAVSQGAGVAAAVLWNVPNEKCEFPGERPVPTRRTEDGIIAYTWRQFLDGGGERPEWLLQLPMTKSVVRAMDTLEAFLPAKLGGASDADSGMLFLLSGASKRGWITWLASATDPKQRVIGLAPVVLDFLNLHTVMHRMWRAYGDWSFAFVDYWSLNITRDLDTELMPTLMAIVDPYTYRARLTQPKLVINAGGDEFFQVDDSRSWWDQMPDPKIRLMVANAEHSMATGLPTVVPSITVFARAVMLGDSSGLAAIDTAHVDGRTNNPNAMPARVAAPRAALAMPVAALATAAKAAVTASNADVTSGTPAPLPQLSWSIDDDAGEINVTLAEGYATPSKVMVRYADTADDKRRDWRLAIKQEPCPTIEIFGGCVRALLWGKSSQAVVQTGDRQWTAHMGPPEGGGWRAFFVELQFESGAGGGEALLTATSEVAVTPNTWPFDDCKGTECQGELV